MSSSPKRRRIRGAKLRLVLLPLVCALDAPDACANDLDDPDVSSDVEFDTSMLKLRGIDPGLADYFREAPRYTAGRHRVALSVNGRSVGPVSARFDDQGALCVDRALLDVAGITAPRTLDREADPSVAASCVAVTSLFPSASTQLSPARREVSLVVPTDTLRAPLQDISGYASGGRAALLNYEIVGLDSRWDSRNSRYWSANTEAGFNAGDWVVRSRQVSTAIDGRHRTEVLDTYAQRTFADRRAVLQLGEINLLNPVLSGAQITGVQVMSEQALATQGGGATIEGVAQSQARVEIRQDGMLVYSTVVPTGPFVLTNIPRTNRHSNLDVSVTGVAGDVQRFVVTAAMAGPAAPSAGYSFAVGKTRNVGNLDAPWVASGGWSGAVRRNLTLSSGAMLATRYHAVGMGLGLQRVSGTQLQLDVAGSRTVRQRVSGARAVLTLSQRVGDDWSFALSQTRQSGGFRELLDATRINGGNGTARYRDQSSASLSWSRPTWGSFSASYSRTALFDGRATRRALASWGTRLGRASVSLSAEWNLTHTRRAGNNSIYLNVSVPLGDSRRLATTVRRYAGESRYGANFSEQVNEFTSYRAGLEYRSGDHRRSLTTAVSLLPRYVQLDAGYARDTRSTTTTLGLRGGLVLHEQGLTMSPYAVRDTFGVLSVGDTAGIRVSTPAGPVWTDARGYAVLPQLSPYGKSSVEVATDSLPRNVDIQNGAAVVEVGRGAVTRLDFGVEKTRRLLVRAHTTEGRAVPAGASVTDENDEWIGMVQGNGEIFIPNALATPRLWVSGPDVPRCELHIESGERAEQDDYFESAVAVCRRVEDRDR